MAEDPSYLHHGVLWRSNKTMYVKGVLRIIHLFHFMVKLRLNMVAIRRWFRSLFNLAKALVLCHCQNLDPAQLYSNLIRAKELLKSVLKDTQRWGLARPGLDNWLPPWDQRVQMEGSLLRCQPVSWIKMTHLFTQEPHKVLLLTEREPAGSRSKGHSKFASAAFPACQESLLPCVESHQRGAGPRCPGDRLGCVIRGGRKERRSRQRQEILAGVTKNLATWVSVTE